MQFTDGVRIDLAFDPLEYLLHLGEDSLTTVLLDKDNRIPPLPPASDRGYHTRRPTRKLFDETVNDIFWCSGNVAKGIWRDELAYVKYMADNIVRTNILHLLEWYAAMNHGWSITTGAYGKWLESFLPPEVWEQYTRTYAGPDYDDTWEALFTALSLVRQIGPPLAQHLGYEYPLEDDRRVIAHLQRVRALPRSATEYPGMDAQP
jgi:aminoglycoside 6-adenylyltransferase